MPSEPVRIVPVISIEKGKPVPGRTFCPPVARCRYAGIGLTDDPDLVGKTIGHLQAVIRRAIVYHDNLVRRPGLFNNRLYGPWQAFSQIVDRDDHREFRWLPAA